MSMKKQATKFIAFRLEEKQAQRLEDVRYAASRKAGKRIAMRALVKVELDEFLRKIATA